MDTSTSILQISLGVVKGRSGRVRRLLSSRIVASGERASAPAWVEDPNQAKALFGVPSECTLTASVPRDHVGPMTHAMQMALAMHLRREGRFVEARALEEDLKKQRQSRF